MAVAVQLKACVSHVFFETATSRRVWWCALKCLAWAGMEPPLAQILVVVANIRMRSWMTEVEEGFVSTAVEHELASPKLYGKPDSLLVVC